MIPTVGTTTNSTPQSASAPPASATSGANSLANEQTFLQLLVAQLKNQDPLSPADGLQFVQQLAQFSQLEQSLQMRQDLDTIKTDFTAAPTGAGPSGGSQNPQSPPASQNTQGTQSSTNP